MDNAKHDIIFISHRSTDKAIADYIMEFLVGTGVDRGCIFCSSLPGNDIKRQISGEIKDALNNSVINIAILSKDYYNSAYCLNEAGVIWFQGTPAIIVALPDVNSTNMYGFLNDEYKIRRLDCDEDISALYDNVREATNSKQASATIITSELQKLKEKYLKYISDELHDDSLDRVFDFGNITTDDERIILFYVATKRVRKINRVELNKWLQDNEIYDINISNAFDLLASLNGCKADEDTLVLNFNIFRDITSNIAETISLLQPCFNSHIRLGADEFIRLWDIGRFDDTLKMFVAYIIDEKMNTFGDRWMAEDQIKDIIAWEEKNYLSNQLSDNYDTCLSFFVNYKFVYASSWTSYGNPREYSLCKSVKRLLCDNPFIYADEIERIIKKYVMQV